MSTTTTLKLAVEKVRGHITLDVKRSGVIVTELPPDLRAFWEQKLRRRTQRTLQADDLENSLKHIVITSHLKGSSKVKGIQIGSQLSLSLPANDQYPEELICKGLVGWTSVTVTF